MRPIIILFCATIGGLLACASDKTRAVNSEPIFPYIETENSQTSPELQNWLDRQAEPLGLAPRAKIVVDAGLNPIPSNSYFSALETWSDTAHIAYINPNLPLEGGLRFVANPSGSDKIVELAWSPKSGVAPNWYPAEGNDTKNQIIGGPIYVQACGSGRAKIDVYSLNDILIDSFVFNLGDVALAQIGGEDGISHCDVFYKAVDSKIYRINMNPDIHYASGKHWETIFSGASSYGEITGLAVDIPGGKLYWIRGSRGTLHRAGLDGANPETVAEIEGMSSTYQKGFTLSGDFFYWGEQEPDRDEGGGSYPWRIQRLSKDGQQLTTVVADIGSMRRIFIDADAEKAYWVDSRGTPYGGTDGEDDEEDEGGAVLEDGVQPDGSYFYANGNLIYRFHFHEARLDGSERRVLGEFSWHDARYLSGLAVDSKAGKVYWQSAKQEEGVWTEKLLRRANLDLTDVEVLHDDVNAGGNWPDRISSIGNTVFLDVPNETIYFAPGGNYLHQTNLDGSLPTERLPTEVISQIGRAHAISFCSG